MKANRLRASALLISSLVCSTGALAQAQSPPAGAPCLNIAFVLVRGAPQHREVTLAALRDFLAKETGDSPATTSWSFEMKDRKGPVARLNVLPDAVGGLIMPYSHCSDRMPLDDAEVKEFMRGLVDRMRQEKSLPAVATLVENNVPLDKAHPEPPRDPTLPAPGERQR